MAPKTKPQTAAKWLQGELLSGFGGLQNSHVLGQGTFGKGYAAVSRAGDVVAIKEQHIEDASAIKQDMSCHDSIATAGGHINVAHIAKHFIDANNDKALLIMVPALMDLH